MIRAVFQLLVGRTALALALAAALHGEVGIAAVSFAVVYVGLILADE
jgi:hypothetical protein